MTCVPPASNAGLRDVASTELGSVRSAGACRAGEAGRRAGVALSLVQSANETSQESIFASSPPADPIASTFTDNMTRNLCLPGPSRSNKC